MIQEVDVAVSLRVPHDVKDRITKMARARNTTAHAFMLEAIREKLDAEEARAAFLSEAEHRLANMKKAGMGIPAGEVFDYLTRRAKGEKARRPRPRKLP